MQVHAFGKLVRCSLWMPQVAINPFTKAPCMMPRTSLSILDSATCLFSNLQRHLRKNWRSSVGRIVGGRRSAPIGGAKPTAPARRKGRFADLRRAFQQRSVSLKMIPDAATLWLRQNRFRVDFQWSASVADRRMNIRSVHVTSSFAKMQHAITNKLCIAMPFVVNAARLKICFAQTRKWSEVPNNLELVSNNFWNLSPNTAVQEQTTATMNKVRTKKILGEKSVLYCSFAGKAVITSIVYLQVTCCFVRCWWILMFQELVC